MARSRRLVIRETRLERKFWHAGTYYCAECLGTDVNAAGTIYHNPRRQEWLDAGIDVDSWWCGNCESDASVSWVGFYQFFLWDDPETEQLPNE